VTVSILLNLLIGLVALYFGAEWLVRGAASLAVRFGLTPLMVGLTVVAYGTSTPELLVSTLAALRGTGDIAIGNAIGSNTFNICVILGLTALVCPMRVQLQVLRTDTPIMIGVALLFWVCFLDHRIGLWESLCLLLCIVVYTLLNLRQARRPAPEAVQQEFDEGIPRRTAGIGMDLLLIVGGLAALSIGARFFVDGAVQLARILGVSEAIIGLTIISAGTSLPELASSLMAAWRKQPDIAIGNVVGSNIYNILAILGVSSALSPPLIADGVGQIDVGVMLTASLLMFWVAWTGFHLKRWEGGLLLLLYAGYLWYLWPVS